MARTTPLIAGKVVAITGGARGIGQATAAAFLAAGAKVAIGDIEAELVAKTAAELAGTSGGQVVGLPLDVTDRASFAAFLDDAETELGTLDVLVNNAGIMPTGLFLDEDDAMTDRMIDINLRGVWTGSKLAATRFAPRRAGAIVNIASLAGVAGQPGLATYCGTKHAVVGFTESLHLELRDSGVRVAAVLPGVVRTELSAGAKVPRWLAPLATVDPDAVAGAVLSAVTGTKALVVVPRALGVVLKSMSVLPQRIRYGLSRAFKFDAVFTQADPEARAAYHRRLTGGAR